MHFILDRITIQIRNCYDEFCQITRHPQTSVQFSVPDGRDRKEIKIKQTSIWDTLQNLRKYPTADPWQKPLPFFYLRLDFRPFDEHEISMK